MEDIQSRFFNHLNDLIPENQSVVDVLSELLDVSNDSIYRRLRGETKLTIQEIEKICQHFHISMDSLLGSENQSVTFLYNQLNDTADFEEYMLGIRDHLKLISSKEGAEIRYTAEDLPIFHHFQFPKLTAFKLFYWLRAVMQYDGLMNQKFDTSLIPEKLSELSHETYGYYKQTKTIEIWTQGTVISNCKQLEYFWESGLFENKESALEICDDLHSEIKLIEEYASHASKIPGNPQYEGNYQLYISDIEIGTNCILINIAGQLSTYLTFNTMNKILTTNKRFNQQSWHWIENLMSKSTLVSGVSEKIRYQFFNKCLKRVEQLRERIEAY